MERDRFSRKLAVILHADVVGSTLLVQKNESLAHQRIQTAFNSFSETIAAYGGKAHEIRGDALVAEFNRASDAVPAALAFQSLNEDLNSAINDDIQPQLRIGISLGEVVVADNTLTGAGVVLAQRLEQLAESGGVVVQGSVSETVPTRMPFDFDSLGEQQLKGFDQPVRAFTASLQSGNELPAPEVTATPQAAESGDLQVPDKPSIAVLPFDNLSTDPEQEFFADGITEDIITELSREKDLFVIARNSSSVYKGQTPDIKQVAKDLGVKYVLEGSVRRAGNKIRLNAQLIDGESNRHIWAERYDRSLEDIFEVQDDLSNTIMNTLIQKIQSSSFDRALRRPPQNMIAYDHYVHGMALVLRLNKNDNLLAQQEALKAIELDPNYAKGHGLLSWTHLYGYFSGWFEDRGLALRLGHEAALKSIECDRNDFFSYSALGFAELFLKNHERALNAIDEAVRLSPNNADARAMRAIILNFTGNAEQALQEADLAMRHNPSHPDWYLIGPGRALFILERYQEALPYLERLVNAGDNIPTWRAQLGATYMVLGREAEAKAEISKAVELEPNLNITGILSITPFKDSQVSERYANLLSKAGLPD
jgi:adenylate cyclase